MGGLGAWVDEPPSPNAEARIFTSQPVTGTFALVALTR